MVHRRGFTLIELLVVIAIMVMLVSFLVPAVLRARLVVLGLMTGGQVASLNAACNAYYQVFDAYPGVIENPPNSGGTPSKISGCQNLRLSLLGCSRVGTTYTREYVGPSEEMDRYQNPMVRRHDPFYNPKPEELAAHNQVAGRDTGQDGDYGSTEVFVDFRLSPPRPLLYFRALPGTANTAGFEADDNAVYYDSGQGENSAGLDSLASYGRQARAGFIIISAGIDRRFFTGDDVVSLNK